MSKIEVTQADRDAAQAYIDDRRHFKQTGLPGSGPSARQIMDEHFARHAHAARIEGARAAIEAAAGAVVIGYIHPHHPRLPGMPFASSQIRALDPEQIVKGMSQ